MLQTCVVLSAQIETQKKKHSISTGVPSGKTSEEFTYDLEEFVTRNDSNDDIRNKESSDESENLVDDKNDEDRGDEHLTSFLTLSRFRRDMMDTAPHDFPKEQVF